MKAVFEINGHDYTKYVKHKTGLQISRENVNEETAGRDESDYMHTDVRSHQRKLELTMGPMSYETAMQLEKDLISNDDGVMVKYPDLSDGVCSRLFYNTTIKGAYERFEESGDITVDNIRFTLTTVEEKKYAETA